MPLSQIRIVHQDDALLVVDKPTLLLSVPGRADDNKDCLVTRLQENGYPEARIVHRLDWETSGLMVLARDADSHRELSRQFHDRETEKAYTEALAAHERLCLHASLLCLTHPQSGERLRFESPAPF